MTADHQIKERSKLIADELYSESVISIIWKYIKYELADKGTQSMRRYIKKNWSVLKTIKLQINVLT